MRSNVAISRKNGLSHSSGHSPNMVAGSSFNNLVEVVKNGQDPVLRKRAWELMLMRDHTNLTFIEIIECSSDKEIREHAWHLLSKKDISPDEIFRILIGCKDHRILLKAWKKLSHGSLTEKQLIHIIQVNTDEVVKDLAAKRLQLFLKCTIEIDEAELIKKIARKINARPRLIETNVWQFGAVHSIMFWACKVNRQVKKMKKFSNARTTGYAALPSLSHLFYEDKKTVVDFFKQVIHQ